MNNDVLQYILRAFWHGFSAGTVTLCTAAATIVQSQKRMPVDWEWLVIGAGAFVAFMSGVNSYVTKPS